MGISLCGLTADEIFSLIEPAGFSLAQAISVANSVYKKRLNDISQFPRIPKKLREELVRISCPGISEPVASKKSSDGTVKYLFRNDEGLEYETVYLPGIRRNTVCVSTQSGCRMGCSFCVTGKFGFQGNLAVRDMVNQILGLPDAPKVNHVVFMGMGEPMDNLENVLKACRIITSEWGLSVSAGNVTVSTVGITPGVARFLEQSNCNLTLSLHSPFPEERLKIIPVEKRYPFHGIIEIMKNFQVSKKRRMSIAYVMINHINDTDSHLKELKNILEGSGIRVNLLPYHSIPGDSNTTSSRPYAIFQTRTGYVRDLCFNKKIKGTGCVCSLWFIG